MLMSSRILVFILGFSIGFCLYFLTLKTKHYPEKLETYNSTNAPVTYKLIYDNWLKKKGYTTSKISSDQLSYSTNRSELQNKLENRLLFDLIHITCVVFVENAENAFLVLNTWGHKCNSLVFYSTFDIDNIEVHVIPRKNSWQFLCDSLRHLWASNDKLQWALFSPDDVFTIVDNLRYIVATRNYNKDYYLGHNVVFWNQIYNSGKTGYVLSKGAIKTLVDKFNNSISCEKSGKYMNNADYYLGKHLSQSGISAEDSRDEKQKDRFHIFTFPQMTSEDEAGIIKKYSKTSLWPITVGLNCCSETSISFRSPESGKIYLYLLLLYQVKVSPYGKLGNRAKNESDTYEVWKEFVRLKYGKYTSVNQSTYFKLWSDNLSEPEDFNKRIRNLVLGTEKTNS